VLREFWLAVRVSCRLCRNIRPTPPRKLDLQGIQSIRVEVTNASEFHHLDPSDLAQAVANAINWRTRETGVNAHIQKEAAMEMRSSPSPFSVKQQRRKQPLKAMVRRGGPSSSRLQQPDKAQWSKGVA